MLYRSKKSTMNGRASEPSQSNPSDNKCTKDIGKEESIKAK
jgi:hypothetical protein